MQLAIILYYYCDQPSSFSQAPSSLAGQTLSFLFLNALRAEGKKESGQTRIKSSCKLSRNVLDRKSVVKGIHSRL